jgi:hypothetical protein
MKQFYFFVYNKPEFRLLHGSNDIEVYKNNCIISHTKDTAAQSHQMRFFNWNAKFIG